MPPESKALLAGCAVHDVSLVAAPCGSGGEADLAQFQQQRDSAVGVADGRTLSEKSAVAPIHVSQS